MKSQKLKTYVFFISLTYPAYHSRRRELTGFVEKISSSIKIHTFRGNYPLWEKRIQEVLAGNAVIVIKYHTLGRYVKGNQQIEFARLDKNSGIGIQKVMFRGETICSPVLIEGDKKTNLYVHEVSKNDGLTVNDFVEWFYSGAYDMNKPFACIHFTPFRYGQRTSN